MSAKTYDVFISHASEDKDVFVRPLAESLRYLGVNLWYDDFTLSIGDSLSEAIDRGLAASRFGIVVLSPNFMAKNWPKRELRGLVARDVDEQGVILPIWHGVTKEQVLEFSPPLADTVALNTEDLEAEDMALELVRVIRPDIYVRHPRAELSRLASGEALRELKSVIDTTREQLSEARQALAEHICPTCGSGVARTGSTNGQEVDETFFQCGFRRQGQEDFAMCPQHSDFPDLYDFTVVFIEDRDGWDVLHVEGRSQVGRLAARTLPGVPGDSYKTVQDALEAWVRHVWNPTVRDTLRKATVDVTKVAHWQVQAFDDASKRFVRSPSAEDRFRLALNDLSTLDLAIPASPAGPDR